MDAYQATESFIRGDDEPLGLHFTERDANDNIVPVDITGYTVMLTIKKDPTDADADAILALDVTEHTNPTQGITVVEITENAWDTGYKGDPVPSGTYHFDVQYVDTDGKPKTVMIGTCVVVQDVTHRTAAA